MIRYAQKNETEIIKKLWNYCFNDSFSFVDYYFKYKYKNNNTLVVVENEKIVSSLQLNEYKINLNNKTYNTSYIVGVSTLPQSRGKGYMKEIMKFALDEIYNKNHFISILMPIDFRLYEKYGYSNCYDVFEYSFNVDEIDNFKMNKNFFEIDESNYDILVNNYNEFLKSINGYVVRDKFYYENYIKEIKSENGFIYGNEEGYITYFINESEMFVREIYYKNISTLKSMLSFIYNHNTQIKKVRVNAPLFDKIRFVLKNPKNINVNLKCFMMGRIIKVKEFLESINLENNINLKINIKIKDDYIKQNNKVFEIKTKNKKVFVTEINEKTENVDEIDINILSKLCFSYANIYDLIFDYDLNLSDETTKVLSNLFTKKVNYINEYV